MDTASSKKIDNESNNIKQISQMFSLPHYSSDNTKID